jgi:hypothetical protein
MNEPVDIEVVRVEALRKLGRNIVNFSKIEGVLKYLLSVNQIELTDKSIQEQLIRNRARLRKQTLGKLTQEFTKNILGDSSQLEPETDCSEAGVFFSLEVICNSPDFLKRKKRELSTIVAERNKLIHDDLALLDTSSVEAYRELISLLDEQNPRLLAQLDEFGWIVGSLRKGVKTLEDLFQLPDFPQCLQSDSTDAEHLGDF